MLTLAGIELSPALVIRAANQSKLYLSWATFATLVISEGTTALQAARFVGAGHILIMGTSGTVYRGLSHGPR